jgi:CBS-domain-containing membrane protein
MRRYLGSFIASFIGISLVSFIDFYSTAQSSHTSVIYTPDGLPKLLVASFGASAVLIYGEIESPLAQPYNAFIGQILSATVGVAVCQVFTYCGVTGFLWIQCGLAVSLALLAMQLTRSVHPPGGATAIVAITGGESIRNLGFWYVLIPVGAGTAILLVVALFVHPLLGRVYPSQPMDFTRVLSFFPSSKCRRLPNYDLEEEFEI